MTCSVIFVLKSKEVAKMLWFKKTDMICGMKQEKGKGIEKHGKWFCGQNCVNEYNKGIKNQDKKSHSCCH